MSYGWATVFTLAAWFAGLVVDVNVRVGDLGLRIVLPVIVMGCYKVAGGGNLTLNPVNIRVE